MLKDEIKIKEKNNINYLIVNNKIQNYKPWLGSVIFLFYDWCMKKVTFPKLFNANIEKHEDILRKEYSEIKNKRVLEIATGSGNIANMLNPNNIYRGIDISKDLLSIASKKFKSNNYKDYKLYLASADDLPFKDNIFDYCICNLCLNFFEDIKKVINEIRRVLKKSGVAICCVPISDRNEKKVSIKGNLYSEKELKNIFNDNGFKYELIDENNGILLYFKVSLKK